MKNEKNILILSAGRRVGLLENFCSAVKNLEINSKIYTCDANPEMSPACQLSVGSFKTPKVYEESYLDYLLSLCDEQDVKVIVPTIDTELEILSKNRNFFLTQGIEILVSDFELVGQCNDKRKTVDLFERMRVSSPMLYDNVVRYPCFCKPFDGSGGVGGKIIKNELELKLARKENSNYIFCELIGSDFVEYTVDAYYSKCASLVSLIPRERLEVRGGEAVKAITRKDFVYHYLVERFKIFPGARGCLTLQFFVNKQTKCVKGIEINPRFGGGYPLTYRAGALFPDWILREYLLGERMLFFEDWQTDLTMLRFDKAVFCEK